MKNITKIIMLGGILAGAQITTTHCMLQQPLDSTTPNPTKSVAKNKKFMFTSGGLVVMATGCAIYAITKKSYLYGLVATGLCAATIGLKMYTTKKQRASVPGPVPAPMVEPLTIPAAAPAEMPATAATLTQDQFLTSAQQQTLLEEGREELTIEQQIENIDTQIQKIKSNIADHMMGSNADFLSSPTGSILHTLMIDINLERARLRKEDFGVLLAIQNIQIKIDQINKIITSGLPA